jgi:alkylation response protein AidB-like acyl-CoA dehydrogenase
MDFTWSDDEQALRAELRGYIAEHLAPGWQHLDRDMPTPAAIDAAVEFCQGLADRGLLTPAWAKEDGGRGASKWAQVVISEELRAAGEPRGAQYANVNWLGPAIRQLGTEEQRKELLGPIAAGEAMWCQGFSEPDAGSDLSALRTSAKRDGDHYIVNGQKIWTSYAHAADHCFLLVRTAREGNPRRGITVLLVPMDSEGIEVREIPTLGIHHMLHEVFFADVRVPVSCRLGAENQGWDLIRTLLANERTQVSIHEEADRGLDQLVSDAVEAGIDTEAESFWESLGRAAASAAASRVLNYVAVQAWSDGSRDYPNHAAVSKAAAAQMASDAAQAHIAVLGAEALLEPARGDYQLISAIESGIGGGSLEMQLNSIAWHVLGLPRG